MSALSPATPARNSLIDTVRGFALVGVFVAHMFEQYEIYWAAPQENLLHKLVATFVMGKAVALLTLCFGLSFFLLMDRAAKRGTDFSGRFAWRMAILAVIGVIHGLLYRGDILILFGTLGLLLIPFHRASNRVVLILAAVLLAQPWEIARIALAATGASWANHAPLFFGDNGPAFLRTAGFLDVLRWNITEGAAIKTSWFVESGRIWSTLALFMVGMWLGRIGFFERPEKFRRARRLALPALLASVVALHFGQDAMQALLPSVAQAPIAQPLGRFLLGEWFNVAVMGIYVIAAVELYEAGGAAIMGRLAPTGRMTLTLYIVQSLVWVPVFYGFGLGAWATMSQGMAIVVTLVYLALQTIAAEAWFRRYHYGPLEWVWRAATYRTLTVPFSRRAPKPARPAIPATPRPVPPIAGVPQV